MATFNILVKAETIVSYIFDITTKSPKKLKNDITSELRKEVMILYKNLIRVNNCHLGDSSEVSQRKNYQKEAIVSLQFIDSLCAICVKSNFITNHQLEVLTNYTYELQSMILKWIESDSNRIQ